MKFSKTEIEKEDEISDAIFASHDGVVVPAKPHEKFFAYDKELQSFYRLSKSSMEKDEEDEEIQSPTVHSYSRLIGEMSKKNLVGKQEKAFDLLHELQQAYKDKKVMYLKPNVFLYGSVLSLLSHSKSRQWAHRAEALFNEMKRKDNNDCMPDEFCYATILSAHTRCENFERAAHFVMELDENNPLGLKAYVSVLSRIAKSVPQQPEQNKYNVQSAKQLFEHYKMRTTNQTSATTTTSHPDNATTNYTHLAVHNSFMDVYGRLLVNDGGASKAEEILRQMYRDHEESSKIDKKSNNNRAVVKPCSISFLTVMCAYSRLADTDVGALDNVIRLLREMQDRTKGGEENVAPSLAHYFLAISQLAKKGGYEETILELYQDLYDSYKKTGDDGLKPNVKIYSAVLGSLTHSRKQEGARRAEEILQEMEAEGIQPDGHCYTKVLRGYVSCGDFESAIRLLLKLENKEPEDQCNNDGFLVDELMYLCILSGIAKSNDFGHKQIPTQVKEKRIRLAEKLFGHYKIRGPSSSLLPSTLKNRDKQSNTVERQQNLGVAVHNAFMNIYGKLSVRDRGAAKAEKILRQMYKDRLDAMTNNDVAKMAIKPCAVSFLTVIHAYSRFVGFDATALNDMIRLLREMQDRTSKGERHVRPNIAHYYLVISHLSKHRGYEETILEFYENLCESYRKTGSIQERPTIELYDAILNSLIHSGKQKWAKRAEEILKGMQVVGIRPNKNRRTMILKGHVNCGNFERAAKLLLEWEEENQRYSGRSSAVDESMYVSILSTIAKSNDFGNRISTKVKKKNIKLAEALFERYKTQGFGKGIQQRKRSNITLRRRNTGAAVYNAFMNVYGRLLVRQGGAVKAEEILRQMYKDNEEQQENVKPCSISYLTVIRAYSRWANHYPGATKDVIRLLQEMQNRTLLEGEEGVCPTVAHYFQTTLLLAKHRGYEPVVVDFYQTLLHLYDTTRDPELRPTMEYYDVLLGSLAHTTESKWAERAEDILQEMRDHQGLDPSSHCLTAVLRAHDNCQNYRHVMELWRDIQRQSSESITGDMRSVVFSTMEKIKAKQEEEQEKQSNSTITSRPSIDNNMIESG